MIHMLTYVMGHLHLDKTRWIFQTNCPNTNWAFGQYLGLNTGCGCVQVE